jgi:SAM-dependent methyltransferase
MHRPGAFYFGVFLTTLSVLVYQVVTTRILSALTWYHLAFLSISLAMLGMTAAGLYVYLWAPPPTAERTRRVLVSHSIWFAASVPLCHVGLISLVLPVDRLEAGGLAILAVAVGLAALPFFFSGVVVAVALTETPLPTGRIYGVDLVGASLGCLAAVALLELLDPSTVCLVIGALAGSAAIAFSVGSNGSVPKLAGGIALALVALAVANALAYPHLIWISRMNEWPVPTEGIVVDRWNSHSRVVAWELGRVPPHFWGQGATSRAADALPEVEVVGIQIDGAAFTAATSFDGDPKTLDWVRHGVTSVAFQIRGGGEVAVIGVGGGRDVLTALGAGARRVLGIEVNGVLVELLRTRLRELTGLVGRDDFTLVHDDGRSWMARTDQRFDLIQMALIDSFASTSAGAMTLTENGLYTREAWSLFLDRLRPGGVLSLSRYYHPGRTNETARALSLAVDTLLQRGVEDPAAHIMLVSAGNVSNLVVGRDPLTPEDIRIVRSTCRAEGFSEEALPGYVTKDPTLRGILEAKSRADLEEATRHPHFHLGASTDDRPFFFNMLKLSAWRDVPVEHFGVGVIVGNLRATQTLVGLLRIVVVLAGLTILGPLLLRGRRHGLRTPTFLAASGYFSLIGLGFMLVEIGLMQKFSILLGHPLHSLAITLMSMILASGLGSFAADRIALMPPWRLSLLPALAALLIVAGATTVQSAIDLAIGVSLPWRAVTVVVFTFPIGFALGFFFPLGLKRLKNDSPVAQSWMWGMNGAFGVLGGLASIVISMSFGIRTCLLIGAACYLLLSLPAHHLHGRARTGQDS